MVLWIFGYGSLVWKAGFEYEEQIVGFIRDYRRVFYQGNTDHRGSPENPGRTVTLQPQEGAICWGVAYRVSGNDSEQLVLSYLEVREKEYDVRAYLDFFTVESSSKPAISGVLVYIGSSNRSDNKFYLGPAPVEEIASQIARSVGPAGPNHEYLFKLEEALRKIGREDEGVIELADEVRKMMQLMDGEVHCFPIERSPI
ncbi:hypothetical protein O6H91_03G056000 [Diphasiastrum complanatum]|uniref:Uncharacterized protein n=3 Tax=Diphasiastrum complanatum TaxID=34168 RepID=A0ACC2E6D9_DIPCM|nr:hypothetical protein O6H91_03G056000 [Diphasiastrum complanatum]KAJ7562140.1 hypothetical protein O6H91_03G056000 [Diphasiastrum complanatum]KAJ7562142.1 hypothetical protein O6H91_03G056000 [Diphasiastrum complanatum]